MSVGAKEETEFIFQKDVWEVFKDPGLGDHPTTGKASHALFQARVASPWKNEGVSFSSVSLGLHFKRIHKMTKKGLLKKNSPEFSGILQTC